MISAGADQSKRPGGLPEVFRESSGSLPGARAGRELVVGSLHILTDDTDKLTILILQIFNSF